jgi:branched-chain amino acid aminotransferase
MSGIAVSRTNESRLGRVDFRDLPFGRVFSDHMLLAAYEGGAWQAARVEPLRNLLLHPATSALQYGQSVFEGLKAFRQDDGTLVIFRPRANHARLNRSAARLAMPTVAEALFVGGLRTLVGVDAGWVPPVEGGSLYIRPFLFATDDSILVRPSERYLFVTLTCPVTAYFSKPVRVVTAPQYVRAFEGGAGDAKPAGNYAPALAAEREARASGFDSVLWLDGRERRFVEECGVMNVFFVIGDTVVTPALTGTILAGVTRDSVITLFRDEGYRVEERRVALDEVFEAAGRGELREAFGTGTAATVVPVASISHEGRQIELPPVADWAATPFALKRLADIRLGRAPDRHGWLMRV